MTPLWQSSKISRKRSCSCTLIALWMKAGGTPKRANTVWVCVKCNCWKRRAELKTCFNWSLIFANLTERAEDLTSTDIGSEIDEPDDDDEEEADVETNFEFEADKDGEDEDSDWRTEDSASEHENDDKLRIPSFESEPTSSCWCSDELLDSRFEEYFNREWNVRNRMSRLLMVFPVKINVMNTRTDNPEKLRRLPSAVTPVMFSRTSASIVNCSMEKVRSRKDFFVRLPYFSIISTNDFALLVGNELLSKSDTTGSKINTLLPWSGQETIPNKWSLSSSTITVGRLKKLCMNGDEVEITAIASKCTGAMTWIVEKGLPGRTFKLWPLYCRASASAAIRTTSGSILEPMLMTCSRVRGKLWKRCPSGSKQWVMKNSTDSSISVTLSELSTVELKWQSVRMDWKFSDKAEASTPNRPNDTDSAPEIPRDNISCSACIFGTMKL